MAAKQLVTQVAQDKLKLSSIRQHAIPSTVYSINSLTGSLLFSGVYLCA